VGDPAARIIENDQVAEKFAMPLSGPFKIVNVNETER
jgi:hypothetical protein